MTERFLKFIPFIFKWEGGYDNDKDDPGGETKFGIDKRSHPREDIRNLTKERATQIYFESYWQPNGCEAMPQRLGEVYFNACVNCGAGRAHSLLAKAGDWERFLRLQEDFYHRLAVARPASRKYLKGWLNRLYDLKKTLS